MKGSDKAVMLGVVMAIVLAGFYLKVLSPKREKASTLGKENTELQAQIDQQEQTAEFGEQARAEFPKYYGRLVVLGKAVPADSDTASLLVTLNSVSQRTGVDFLTLKLGQGGGATGASPTASAGAAPSTASTPTTGTTPAAGSTTTTPSGGTPTTPSGGSAPASGGASGATAASSTTPAPATEAGAANLPIGATVGAAGLPVMPYNLAFTGSYFDVAEFLKSLDRLVDPRTSGQIAANGRLLTVNGFSLTPVPESGINPDLSVSLSVTSYVSPPTEGLTAGASPTGPAPSTDVQPASQPVSP